MMNLSVNIQTIALDPDELKGLQRFASVMFDCDIHKHPTIADELIIKGDKANVRNMLIWHYQSKEDAMAMYPEAF